jgi:hypothetical protein
MTRPATFPDRCYWIKDENGTEVLVPMCYGSAHLGSEGCTCTKPQSEIEKVREELDRATQKIERLQNYVADLKADNADFRAMIKAMRKREAQP